MNKAVHFTARGYWAAALKILGSMLLLFCVSFASPWLGVANDPFGFQVVLAGMICVTVIVLWSQRPSTRIIAARGGHIVVENALGQAILDMPASRVSTIKFGRMGHVLKCIVIPIYVTVDGSNRSIGKVLLGDQPLIDVERNLREIITEAKAG